MINNDNFLIKEIPKFHAISQKYDRLEFWKNEKRKCIDGEWIGGKWCPGSLYFFVNYFTIRFETDDGSAGRKLGRPFFRDVEWERAYVTEEAMGFSGFSEDTLYTCDKKYGPEKDKALRFGWITEDEIAKKIYVPAREYLRKIHPANLGKPLYANQAKNILELTSRGCLAEGTRVLMYDGSIKNIEDVSIGDELVGKDGNLRTVLDIHDGVDDLYKITNTKNNSFDNIIVNSNHILSIREHKHCNGKYINGKRQKGRYEEVFTNYPISELIQKQKNATFNNIFYRYKPDVAINFKNGRDIDIDPYYLGLWLADGRSNCTSIKITDSILWKYLVSFAIKNNIRFSEKITQPEYNRKEAREYYYHDDALRGRFNNYKLLLNKHIPKDYLVSSVENRLQLLAGIIDGDGTYDKKCKNIIIYVGLSKKLAEEYLFLCRSLGFQSTLNHRDRGSYKRMYQIILNGDLSVIPTKLHRKNAPHIDHRNSIYSTSFNISKCGYGKYYGLVVDVDGEYLLSDFSVDHNTGKSYFAACQILYNFLFDGATDYDVYLENKKAFTPLTSDTVVGAIESKYTDDLLRKVKIAIEHLPDKQMINGEIYPSPFFVNFTGSLQSGKSLSSTTGSVINVRSFADDPLAANGTRPNKAFIEETGFMNNFIEVIGALEATQASADNKNLVIHALGTGGLSNHGAVTYTKEVFYNPEEFNFVSFDDVWENKGKIGFFIPGIMGLNKFKIGPNKITDEENARKYIEEEIEKAKNSGNRRRYMAEIINKPLKPSDIFLTVEGNFFPIDDLREQLAEIENNKKLLEASWKVQFIIKDGVVDWQFCDKPILRDYPHKRGDVLDTAIEMWEIPKTDNTGKVPFGRYIASLDPVDNDGGDDVDHSLLSGFILDSWTDRLVAEYTGRTKLTGEFYEQWRRCLMYFNAPCNYERNLKGFYPHMKNSNSLHLLCDEPEILREKGLTKGGGTGNQSKGTHGSVPVINWGLELILDWLNKPMYNAVKNEEDEVDNTLTNLMNIKSPALLQELIAYNSEINTDRVSAFIYLMILREDRSNMSKNALLKRVETVTTNRFWDKAYKSSNSKFNSRLY